MSIVRPLCRFLLLLSLPVSAMAVCKDDPAAGLRHYDGFLADKHRIRMSLVLDKGTVSGVYFYASQLKDIKLKGLLQGGKHLVLDEIDNNGKTTARFEGDFVERDPRGKFAESPLSCEVIVGTWQKLNATSSLPLYLSSDSIVGGSLAHRYEAAGVKDDEQVHQQAAKFWTAVKQGDKETVAVQISYPIKVNLAGKRQRLNGPQQLLVNYDKIFHPDFRQAIVSALPRNMFARDQGIMLGGGEVWFGPDGKVISLNN